MIERILLIAGEFPPFAGGIANAAFNLSDALAKRVRSLTVIAPRYKDGCSESEIDKFQPYRIYRLPLMRLRFFRMLPMTPAILDIAARERPNFVIAMRATREGIPALAIKKLLGVPFVLFAHGLEFARFSTNSVGWRFCSYVYRQSEKVMAISETTKKLLIERGILAEKISVVRLGVGNQIFEPVEPMSKWNGQMLTGRRVILSVSRLVERKGIDKVIEAMPLVLERCPDAVYIVVGDGSYGNRLKRLAQEKGVSDRVLFTGRVPDIRTFYHACDVFVLPTRENRKGDIEGFGLVYLEAAACGKPVIASLVGGVSDAVVPNETALIVDPYDPKSIADAIVKILTDKEIARKLGRAGRERVLQEFTYDKVAEKVLALMAECVNPKGLQTRC
ncbi:MAG: glycosyltransferase family 4 protein [Armatimonadetes bacterium]|nr:glycosyltransferase family 4 protein [Armatimonadota bacterium]MDW8029466.1 glycosyltransferase family 4 protein [Armatimonadota bacterium]